MKLGFTGTQLGWTDPQDYSLHVLLHELLPSEVHHGDCDGSDAEFHREIFLWFDAEIVIHPPKNDSKRAYCAGGSRITVLKPKEYLVRNRDIVDVTDALLATPATMAEELRSGTWSTVRYARSCGKPVYIVYPDGTVVKENQ